MEEGGDAQMGAPATADVGIGVNDTPSLEPNSEKGDEYPRKAHAASGKAEEKLPLDDSCQRSYSATEGQSSGTHPG